MLRGRGRAGGRSSRLLRAIKISQGSLKPPRTTRSAAISTPPRVAIAVSVAGESIFVGTRKRASRSQRLRRWCGTHLPRPSRWDPRARRGHIRCRGHSLHLKSRSAATWRSSFSAMSAERLGAGFESGREEYFLHHKGRRGGGAGGRHREQLECSCHAGEHDATSLGVQESSPCLLWISCVVYPIHFLTLKNRHVLALRLVFICDH